MKTIQALFQATFAAALALLFAASTASSDVYKWSQTPGTNTNVDITDDINLVEGMAPSEVNDSVRAVMAELRKWIDDMGASKPASTVMVTAGTANVQTLSTNGTAPSLTHGHTVCFTVGSGLTNTSAATLNVDGFGAKAVQAIDGTALAGGELAEFSLQCATYQATDQVWLLHQYRPINGTSITYSSTGKLQVGTLSGDVTSAVGVTTIANDAVTNAKAANMATATIKGRTTAGTGDPEDLTGTQATALMNACVGDAGAGGTKGLVPAPGAGDAAAVKFLKADCTWAAPSGAAPTTADYLVKTADAGLSAERVVTDTTSITVDWATGGQAKFKRAALTGDVTASADSNTTAIGTSKVLTAMIADANVTQAKLATDVTNRQRTVGEVIEMSGSTCPSYTLEANGASLADATYPALLAYYVTKIYGNADASHFNLPDYRGRFLRAWDHAAAVDPNAGTRTSRGDGTGGDVVGSKQGSDYLAHLHDKGTLALNSSTIAVEGSDIALGTSGTSKPSANNTTRTVTGSTGTSPTSGGSETRPINTNVLYCIFTGV